ncbi:efflux RND transporter periplasmic adaptor subunit [Psittacicella gerlachiana]|uniref:Multidrug resistance protein MdtA-like barrel-sandwich hybrid domain-containing protein n=1 Tax=Psittacicella gerlachiana TaxID=2028574 RepID=A0A3A1YGP6_9GAMM|nr:efflux RND transporter periplasmic adaptor subunit [Psittacicella gerlachiana]RIY36771.1 hypothetical protein CKF59_02335 [Psittacicella gerlachiana]
MSKRRSFVFYLLISIVVVILVGLSLFSYFMSYQKSKYRLPTAITSVSVIEVSSSNYLGAINSSGFVRSQSTGSLALVNSGKVATINYKPGQKVKKGAVILSLDVASAQATLAGQRASLNSLKLNYDGLLAAYKEGGASNYEVQSALSSYNAQLATVRATEQTIQLSQIIAPFDGVIGTISPSIGDVVSSGTTLVTVIPSDNDNNTNGFFLNLGVSPDLTKNITIGNKVVAYDQSGNKVADGTVSGVDSTISTSTSLSQVRVSFADNANLQDGEFVKVEISTNPVANQITIPDIAVSYSLYGQMVYRLDPLTDEEKSSLEANNQSTDGVYKVTQVYITANDRVNGVVLVTKGLNVGNIIVTNYNNILDGSLVRIAKGYGVGVPETYKLPVAAQGTNN